MVRLPQSFGNGSVGMAKVLRRVLLSAMGMLAAGLQGAHTHAAAAAPPVIPGDARLAEAGQDGRRGALLLGELNCLSCHAFQGAGTRGAALVLE